MKRITRLLALSLVLILLIPGFTGLGVEENLKTERIFGKNRIETSIEVSKRAYSGKADKVFLAGYNGEADALASTFLSGRENGPLLLTYRDRLDPKLLERIKTLDPKEIVILGGESVVGKNVEDKLINEKYRVKRIKGNSRVETATNIASDYYKGRDVSEIFLVEYNSLVDALAIGPVAARDGIPLLITFKDKLPGELSKFLEEKGVKKVTIIGGSSKVSERGREELLKYVDRVDRVYGNNRVATSLKIGEKYFKNLDSITIANGRQFTDALIGGYFAAKENGPIILTEKDNIHRDVLNYLGTNKVKNFVLGGGSVVSDSVYRMVENRGKPVVSPPSIKEKASELEEEVVRLVNIERSKNGLPRFIKDSKLSELARLKSEDMQKNNYFDHTSPKYGSPFQMMKKFGVNYRRAGENIAKGQRSPGAVVKAWMNSPGHRANILNKNFNKIGVGAHEYRGTIYWTQMFTD